VAVNRYGSGRFVKEEWILWIKIGRSQQIARNDRWIVSILFPSPKMSIVGSRLSWDTHSRSRAKGDLPKIFAADKDLGFGHKFGFPSIYK
jgi:hypothetical protein